MQFPSHCIRLLSSQANNSMGYARIFAKAVLNPGTPDDAYVRSSEVCQRTKAASAASSIPTRFPLAGEV